MRLHLGDCVDVLKTIPENSIEALLTDPPAGIEFMGKDWDSDRGGRENWVTWFSSIMKEVHRVLKPGAHGLVWAIPRTSHWTATALEDAGFEVRDQVFHIYGQGFPKSLNISKAIDKLAGAEREVIGPSNRHKGGVSEIYGKGMGVGETIYITAPATEAAKQWDGWGTALKPACEIWILIRKPISEKNIAENVLKWGCGGIAIDICRIEAEDLPEKTTVSLNAGSRYVGKYNNGKLSDPEPRINNANPTGRFPSHLLFSHNIDCDDQCTDGCPVKGLDEQSGILHASGASRFFYCSKISTKERNAGLDGMPDREGGIKNSSGRGFSESDAYKKIITKNHHPTVKPQKLMRYLSCLITPPQGTILDPFMGSGSTGIAALAEGFDFIGIEREEDYFKIAEKRIEHSLKS